MSRTSGVNDQLRPMWVNRSRDTDGQTTYRLRLTPTKVRRNTDDRQVLREKNKGEQPCGQYYLTVVVGVLLLIVPGRECGWGRGVDAWTARDFVQGTCRSVLTDAEGKGWYTEWTGCLGQCRRTDLGIQMDKKKLTDCDLCQRK